MSKPPSADIPRDLRDVLSDLGYIAGLKTGGKYNIKSKTYAAADSWVDAYFRDRDKETKTGAIDFINTALDTAIDLGRKYPAWRAFLTDEVGKISNALTNMEHVYVHRYPGVSSDIKIIRLRIDATAFDMACRQSPIIQSNPLADPIHYQTASEGTSPTFPPSGSSPPSTFPPTGTPPAINGFPSSVFVGGTSPQQVGFIPIPGMQPPSPSGFVHGVSPPQIYYAPSPVPVHVDPPIAPIAPAPLREESKGKYQRRTKRASKPEDSESESISVTETLTEVGYSKPRVSSTTSGSQEEF